MKKSVFVILLCLSSCRMALGSIAYVSGSATTCVQTSSSTTSQTCTLAGATAAGNTVKVGLAWKTTTASISSVTATGCNFFPYKNTTSNGTSESVAVWIGQNCPSISSVTVTLSAGSVWVTTVNEYSGVVAIGQVTSATGSSANPSVSITIQDSSDWVVMESASVGSDGVPTANTGNLRSANLTGSTSSDVAAGACDDTASSGSVTCTDTITSSAWAAIGIELRTANPPDPLLVQAMGTGTNAGSETANGVQFSLPQAALAGNAIICGLTYPYSSSRTVSVTDNESNAWQKAVSVGSTTGDMTVALWYATNVAAGTVTITVTFDTAIYAQQFACKEAYNIVASSPLDGTASVASSTTSSVSTGSITTTANGDLVFEYGNYIAGSGGFNTGSNYANLFVAGPGWSPIIADPESGEFFEDTQQASAGSITPTYDVEVVSGISNAWGAVAAAFKTSSSQGTAPPSSGIHIDHAFSELGNEATTITFQVPFDGNFIAAAMTTACTITDSLQNSYVENEPGGSGSATMFYVAAATTRLGGQIISVANCGISDDDLTWYDIRGVATTSPIDTTAYNDQTQPSLTNGYQWSGMPTITPSAIGELVIADLPTGCGPTSVASAPSGAITDNVYYSGETDASAFNEACGHAHLITTSTAQESWTWVMENASCSGNSSGSAAWAIKPQPTTGRSVTPAHATIF
jgi:hypothetical protein